VKYNGPIKTKLRFFVPKPLSESDTVSSIPIQQNRFRGRKLIGFDFSLPSGYSGFVLTKKGDESEGLVAEKVFNSFQVWKREEAPTKNEPYFRLRGLLNIINTVRFIFALFHSPPLFR
jgi:hypothetical protein